MDLAWTEHIEAMVAEIRIDGDTVYPIFLIPQDDDAPADDEPARAEEPPFRTMVRSVGRTQHRAKRAVLFEGDPLPIRLTSARRRVAPIGGER